MENKYFIIDFDSTLVQVETLDEIARLSLKKHKDRKRLLEEINNITNLGMEGKLSISESLQKRIELLHANKTHINKLISLLRKKITPSFKRNKAFFQKFKDSIYIFSGGFSDYILPIAKQLGIPEKNVFANTYRFSKDGSIIGFDESNIMAKDRGKATQLKNLKLQGEIFAIGDGHTDYQLKEVKDVKFFAFTENIKRDSVVKKADFVVPSFDEFLFLNKLPMSVSYPKNRLHVLLLENIHPRAVEILKNEGYTIEIHPGSLSEDQLAEKIKGISMLGIRSKTEITKKVLDNANRLMAIGAFCIGTNQIDNNACAEKGIPVFNAPYSNTRSVVELVIGKIIMLVRGIFDKSSSLHQGKWQKTAEGSYEIRGKKLGIVGYGNIGSQLSVVAESLGMDVYYYDIVKTLSLGNATKCESMKELLKKVDFLTIHVDGRKENNNLISEKEFKLMKDGVIFINLSRGFVVDIPALTKYIKNGKIKGAAVDVFPQEPKNNKEKFVSELQGLPNVILTPHIGGSTQEAQHNIAGFVSELLVQYMDNGSTYTSVNFPNIQLPKLHKAHRLLHIHENIPGILAQINNILAKNNINIEGQYLKTNEQIGYTIADVNKKYNQKVIEELKKISNTIKFRVLY